MKYLRAVLLMALAFSLSGAGARAQLLPMPPPAFDPNVMYGYGGGYGGSWNPYPGYPGGGWGGQPPPHPAPPYLAGFTRAQCINFEFRGVRPSAELKLRIVRTAPANRTVLYQRALFVLKYETDAPARATANWVRLQIEALPPQGA